MKCSKHSNELPCAECLGHAPPERDGIRLRRGAAASEEMTRDELCHETYEVEPKDQDSFGGMRPWKRGYKVYIPCLREAGHPGPHCAPRTDSLSFEWGDSAANGIESAIRNG